MKRTISTVVSALLCLVLLAGCQTKQEDKQTGQESDYGTVTIENGDRTVTFTKMPEAVICANLYSAENMVMLGLEDKIAGKNIPTNDAEKPLEELKDKFANIKELDKSNESVVAAQADLVIGQISTFKDDAWGSFEKLESEGVNSLVITGTLVEDETVEHVYQDIRNLGKIFKVEDKAEALITDIQKDLTKTQEAVKSVKEEEKVKVFVMDSFNGNEIYTTSSGLQSNLIELAGGINATKGKADSRWFNTSVETLVEANPDVIIFNDYGKQSIAEKKEFINNNPAMKDIPAVKNQNYLEIPLVAVMQDVRVASACQTFAEHFYPQCFQN